MLNFLLLQYVAHFIKIGISYKIAMDLLCIAIALNFGDANL